MGDVANIEHQHFRSALEFAVLMAAEGQKRKPALAYPKELKPFFNKARLPSTALGRLRRVIDADPVFRSRLASGALPELVDDIGRLWLEHSDGWEDGVAKLAAQLDAAAESGDSKAQLRSAEKRREAAEHAAARTRVELLQRDDVLAAQTAEIDDLRAEVAKAAEAIAEIKTELTDVRMEIRHARDREAAAGIKASAAEAEAAQLRHQLAENLSSEQPQVVAAAQAVVAHHIQIAAAVASARLLAEQLDSLLPAHDAATSVAGHRQGHEPAAKRSPLSLPGGVIGTSAVAAEHLARSTAAFIIDGYNVAKLGWPQRQLAQQREAFLDAAENIARRFGTDITVVFDGASIVGAHTSRRRQVRVVYSPEGTIADDVIRDEVRRLPAERAVVVVTNDAEIVRDVRADGANVVPSNALLALI